MTFPPKNKSGGPRKPSRPTGNGDGSRGASAPRGPGAPRGAAPQDQRPQGKSAPRRAAGPRGDGPRTEKSYGDKSYGERSYGDRPYGERTRSERPRDERPRDDRPRNDRPRNDRPRPDRPRNNKPSAPQTRAPAADGSDREGDRIAKLLARAGIASRREVERMIEEGRVKIGDEVVTTPATLLMNLKGVSVDGRPVAPVAPPRLFRFHKPSGLITAERDPTGRPTIYTALRNALPQGTPRVMPVGRLDLNTEGLLLLTNDGELKRALELPATGIPRTYRARTFGDITQARLEELMEGIEIDGIRYGPINANMERSAGRNKWIEVTLTEGKNREVRRVLEHLGLQVSRLLRTSYGPFELADLPRGAAEEVPQVVVERFRKTLKMG